MLIRESVVQVGARALMSDGGHALSLQGLRAMWRRDRDQWVSISFSPPHSIRDLPPFLLDFPQLPSASIGREPYSFMCRVG